MIHIRNDICLDGPVTQGFKVQHDLADHPLLSSAAIRSLADRLPPGSAEIGGTAVGGGHIDAGELVAQGGLDFQPTAVLDTGEALDDLDGTGRSLYLYNVERDLAMAELISEILADAYGQTGMDPAQVVKEEGYLFVTGGPTITPVHVDHEYNFLLVVRGRKKVFLSEVPSVEAERALEKMYSGGYGTCSRVPDRGVVFDVAAGEGIFIPPRSAHYVINADEPCVALSAVFGSRWLQRESAVYRANALLRGVGLNPGPVGRHRVGDAGKALAVAAVRRVRSFA